MEIQKSNIDRLFLGGVISALILGLIVLYLVTVPDNYHTHGLSIFIRQISFISISLGCSWLIFTKTRIDALERSSTKLFLVGLFLIFLTFVPVIGYLSNGDRFLNLSFIHLYPAELMKLIVILFSAKLLAENNPNKLIISSILFLFLALLLAVSGDIIAVVISLSMIFIMLAFAKRKHLFVIAGGFLALVFYAGSHTVGRILEVMGWTHNNSPHSLNVYNWDEGMRGYILDHFHSSFSFLATHEYLGFLGMLVTVLLFLLIITKCVLVSKKAFKLNQQYSAYVAFGITLWLSTQSISHMAINYLTNSITVDFTYLPIYDISLPLFSYGLNSMFITLIALSIILKIDWKLKQVERKNKILLNLSKDNQRGRDQPLT